MAPAVTGQLLRPTEPPISKDAKRKNIQVSPAVLDAARKTGEELLRDLQTAPVGLTQAEAEERARKTGPNEVAQEKPQGWPVRLLKIVRNPLVILLATLSAVSFATGDARAGTVMAMMVAPFSLPWLWRLVSRLRCSRWLYPFASPRAPLP